MHSDEKSMAGQISKILQHHLPPIGIKNEFKSGISHGQGTLKDTIKEWELEKREIYHLDKKGKKIGSDFKKIKNAGFVLSDDKAFTKQEEEILSKTNKISVGEKWIQGHSVIAIIHHYID